MFVGLSLLVAVVVLRGAARNRYVRGRLLIAAAAFAVYVIAEALLQYASLDATVREQIGSIAPLVLAWGLITAIVALAINPWKVDRLPDRFPNIVQDAFVIALFAIAATVVLQERILATTAVGAVVIGFALQDTLGNLFAGLAIQIEKPFRVGHWVQVAGKDGQVREITWRATKIRTKAGNLVVVPNSVLSRDTITNYSEPFAHTRLDLNVTAGYEWSPHEVKTAILDALNDEPMIRHDHRAEALVHEFGAEGVVYMVRFWTDDFGADEVVKDRVRSLIYYAFKRRGISIPYPMQVQIEYPADQFPPPRDETAARAAIDEVNIFTALDPEARAELRRRARAVSYAAGETIVRQDAPGSSMFIVVEGEVKVTLDPAHQEIARLTKGGFFGEMSLLTGQTRSATVSAVADCELLEITADAFRTFVLANPEAVVVIGTAAARRAEELARARAAGASAPAAPAEQPAPLIDRIRRFLRLGAVVLIVGVGGVEIASASEPAGELQVTNDGRRVVTAVEARSPVVLDGVLDEAVWNEAAPASSFVQAEPHEGQPASETTEVRLVFDRDALYVGVRCNDTSGRGAIVNDIRKDFAAGEQDTFEVILDTFADRRNGFVFVINPVGAKSDTQIANEGRDVNTSWDAVWSVATKSTADGWTAELRIPFKTLRFERGADRIWGVNFSRRIRRKNEIDYWSPVPRVYNLYRSSLAGTMSGLPDASQGRNLRIKPWISGDTIRPVQGSEFDGAGHAGLDVKYGVTPSLTLDVTMRPDFAQAEADEQQVNLTQFSLYYPEKREFFLENSGMFYFGDIPRESRIGARFSPPEEELLLFFSRRIGLTDDGLPIPIAAGGRLTGRAGQTGLGLMTIQTESSRNRPGDNYTVLRGRRDVLRNGDVGGIFLSRQSAGAGGHNEVAGVDANFRFIRALSINGFLTRSFTPNVGGQTAAKGSVTWNSNNVHTQYSLLSIGDNFTDDIGFVRRKGIRKHFVDFGLRNRPEFFRKIGIRELHPHTRFNIYTDQHNEKVTHTNHAAYAWFFERGGFFEVSWNPRFERILRPFKLPSGPVQSFLPGTYRWSEYYFELETNHSRKLSGSALITRGGYWSGSQKSTKLALLFRPSYHLTFDAALQRNDIDLPTPMQSFATNLVTSRIGYAFNTRTFLDTLVQYNTDLKQFSSNVRFDLIHRPLSDLFIVYNEQQLTARDVTSGRGLIVKYTHMLAF